METLDYYNNNAKKFIDNTKNLSLTTIQEKFMKTLQPGSYILDLGCGSGRDTKVFLENGFIVDAVDGSKEICKIVSKELNIDVKCMLFSELSVSEKYDAVFACASLLHVQKNELSDILRKIYNSLKKDGILYVSFKYGNNTYIKDGKYYVDLDETSILDIIDDKLFLVKEIWISEDNLPGRVQKWTNAILKRR